MTQPVHIDYYSDVLCVWAYVGQARIAELQAQFSDELRWQWRYLPVFGDVPTKFLLQWGDRGGAAGYAAHVREVVAQFDHVNVHADCWDAVQPASSAPAHLWLAATRLAQQEGALDEGSEARFAWALRLAFFEQAQNVAEQETLARIAEACDIDSKLLLRTIQTGRAFAVLCHDMQVARDANVRVSPTFAFNEDRQRLTGNVGYRIIEANVRELLERPGNQQSWC